MLFNLVHFYSKFFYYFIISFRIFSIFFFFFLAQLWLWLLELSVLYHWVVILVLLSMQLSTIAILWQQKWVTNKYFFLFINIYWWIFYKFTVNIYISKFVSQINCCHFSWWKYLIQCQVYLVFLYLVYSALL